MTIIIPHQLSLAPYPLSPLPFSADRFPIHSGPLFCFYQSAFLFPAIFSPVPFGRLPRSLCSASSFLSVRSFVFFGPFLSFFRSATPFPLACSFVSFVSFACSFWPAPLFPLFRFLFPLVWFYEALPRIQLLSLLVLSPPLSGIFVPLKSDPCPSVLETMPFNVRDNAFLAPRTRPSTFKKTPFSSRLRMCLISCQLQVPFRFIPSSQRWDFRVCSC